MIGAKLVVIRPMSPEEMEQEGWELDNFGTVPIVLVFDDGTKLYASQDAEGNGPGALFGVDAKGESFGLAVVS